MPTPVAGPDRRLSRWKFTGLDEENGLLSWRDRSLALKGRPGEMPTSGDLAPPDLLNRFIDLASGNAAQILMGPDATPDAVAALATKLGLDQPAGHERARDILDLLERMNRERQTAVVMVTHSPEAAARGTMHVALEAGDIGRFEPGDFRVPFIRPGFRFVLRAFLNQVPAEFRIN